jgi:hypothetical protein
LAPSVFKVLLFFWEFIMNKMFRSIRVPTGVAALVLASQAHAAIDVSATVTEISGTLAPIGAIGLAVLAVIVAIKAYGWVKRAIA